MLPKDILTQLAEILNEVEITELSPESADILEVLVMEGIMYRDGDIARLIEQPENSNWLDGLRCPNCEALSPLKIKANCWVAVDDGDGPLQDIQWDQTNFCQCPHCDYTSKVSDFLL